MSKIRLLGSGMRWPKWTSHDIFRGLMSYSNISLAANANARIIAIGHIEWADGETHDIQKIIFNAGTSSAVATLRVSLRDPSTVDGPPGRDDGTVDQFATQVNPAGFTNYTLTLNANRTAPNGQLLACVFDWSAYTSGAINITMMGTSGATASLLRPNVTTTTDGSSFTANQAIPCITFEASDGTFGQLADTYPSATSTSTTVYTYNSGSTPDEHAIEFTVPHKMWCAGASVHVNAAVGADFDVVLYEGTTPLQTVSVITATLTLDASYRWITVSWPDTALNPGSTYRLSLKPTTANNVAIASFATPLAGHLQAFVGPIGYTTRTDSGAWAAVTTNRTLFMALAITGIDDDQIPSGAYTLSGIVTTDGVTPQSGATVTVIDRTTGQTKSTTSDGSGLWSISVDSNTAGRYAAYVEYESGGTTYRDLAPWKITAV